MTLQQEIPETAFLQATFRRRQNFAATTSDCVRPQSFSTIPCSDRCFMQLPLATSLSLTSRFAHAGARRRGTKNPQPESSNANINKFARRFRKPQTGANICVIFIRLPEF
ncbi:hypothetical protein IQ289_25690 [Burkholderia sp. R-70006]|uniref:hypothetical protein n=1 Tax=Paraburkholderia domus TaxID=2793075 RepID=UPI001912B248|nr:hypothetical protein [Paraburkholderia domus]MBK5051778.1 hypothetical protein [Burkholderia sp. R-70006]